MNGKPSVQMSMTMPEEKLTHPVTQNREWTKPAPKQPSKVELVARAQAGETPALNQLIELHSPGIYRFVYRLVRNEQDARDITQEVFLRMLRNFHRYDPSYRFETWLYRIARNLCFDRGRKKQRWKFAFWSRNEDDTLQNPIDQLTDQNPDALNTTMAKEEGQQVESAIQRLKPAYKEILVLYHFEELSYQEIANVLDIPMGTVMNRLFRARKALKKIMTTD